MRIVMLLALVPQWERNTKLSRINRELNVVFVFPLIFHGSYRFFPTYES